MYNHFFHLRKAPFDMTPDPALLYMPTQHREALAGLTYAILHCKGFAVLIGDAGTGKTTLLARTLQCLPKTRIHSSVILNPTLTASEFLEMAMLDFGIKEVPASKAQRLTALQQMLLQDYAQDRVAVLVIDEAHKLSAESLEEIRLLSNFEFAERKLLQIVLIGQNELSDLLNENHLRQLKQRIAVRLSIGPLGRQDVEQYIRYRWTKCGGPPALPFLTESITAIASWSCGIPRLINAICDNALTTAFGQGVNVINCDLISDVARDLDLKTPPEMVAKAPPEPLKTPVKTPAGLPGSEIAPVRIFDAEPSRVSRPSMLARWAGKLGWNGSSKQYE